MGRALKYFFRIVVLAAFGLVGYSMIADLPPPTRDVVINLPMPGPGQ